MRKADKKPAKKRKASRKKHSRPEPIPASVRAEEKEVRLYRAEEEARKGGSFGTFGSGMIVGEDRVIGYG